MKLLTRDTDYAIRALCHIMKQKERMVAVTELVRALKIPRPFLRKILQRLHKKQILEASKGIGGGFSLAIPAKKIFVMDLIEIFQGHFSLNECLFKKKACPNIGTCNLRKRIAAIEKNLIAQLRPVSIACLSAAR